MTNKTALLDGGNGGLGNQAYEALLDLIIARELKQGEQIQERALAIRLGISRTPLREAMHRLEGEKSSSVSPIIGFCPHGDPRGNS
ncbi:GntR family transcriptional regulator [Sodalis ligni]|uniref:GntR family transcriptional regulator n=1 Tax=Sodalis ligni TaxID=2697027 RepID=UPI001BDEB86C|nr:GntR family transcriptional regulator [Sodalis ligni]QWA10958.1 GntR family transcriptional regulator [Sodalis ligni]